MHFDVVLSVFVQLTWLSVCVHFRCVCVCVCVRACVRACTSDEMCVCVHFRCVCVCVCARQMCAQKTSQLLDCYSNNLERFICSCLRAVLTSSPDTWDWTRMHGLAVMHRRTFCENVDSAKIKVTFYTTDIDILRVASMHRIVIHCIDISIHIDESLPGA